MTHPALRSTTPFTSGSASVYSPVLAEASRADFGFIRDALDLTDGNLSRHLTVLADAGLVEVEKDLAGARPRTWVSATKAGRKALDAEVRALDDLISRVNGSR